MEYIQYLREMVGKEKVIMVVAGAFVFDEQNRLLLQLRSDNHTWGIPGGFMDLGESVENTARREVQEETGIELGRMELFGIYSGPGKDKTFPNGDQVSLVQIVFTCKEFTGELQSLDESDDCRFFSLKELPDHIFPEHEMMLAHLLNNKQTPIIG